MSFLGGTKRNFVLLSAQNQVSP